MSAVALSELLEAIVRDASGAVRGRVNPADVDILRTVVVMIGLTVVMLLTQR